MTSYRTITVSNGETIRLYESVFKGAGPQGDLGPIGPPGPKVTILGHYPDDDAIINGVVSPAIGDAYIADDDGHIWTWVGSEWKDGGRIVGPGGVKSMGASRARTSVLPLVTATWANVAYTGSFLWNDIDPLDDAGQVLSDIGTNSTDTITAVDATERMYYHVSTRFSTSSSSGDRVIQLRWTNSGVTPNEVILDAVSVKGTSTFPVVSEVVLPTDGTARWTLALQSTIGCDIESVSTIWTRLAGGVGPAGPPGPPPIIRGGVVTSLPPRSPMTVTLIQMPPPEEPGTYQMNLSLPRGDDGDSVAASFDELLAGDSPSDADSGAPVRTWTDQQIQVPGRNDAPTIPYFFQKMAESLHRKIVSVLTTEQLSPRTPPNSGEVVYNSDTRQFYAGVGSGTADPNAFYVIPTIEYGTDATVVHGAPTNRPTGSLYFRLDTSPDLWTS